jgi:RNA polymerase sigma-70 factor (ECF subfamily)
MPLVMSAATADAATDSDLVARLREGDRRAVEEAYLAHHTAIRGFARRLVGDTAAAEDIVHEAFVALPRAIRRFRGEGSLRAFLIGVAANHSRRHIRSAMRRRRATERLAVHEDLQDRTVDATDQLIHKQLASRLWAALDELPLDQRLVFVLCEAEQRTSVEVAGIVGAPEGTVRTRLFHAKRKLREMLGHDLGRRSTSEPERMPERTPERMPERMTDRQPVRETTPAQDHESGALV